MFFWPTRGQLVTSNRLVLVGKEISYDLAIDKSISRMAKSGKVDRS